MQQSSQFDKHESKSEVVEYKAAADVTNPKTRGVDENDDDEKPATKKITVEDVEGGEKKKEKKEEMEAEAEPVAQVKSEKKKRIFAGISTQSLLRDYVFGGVSFLTIFAILGGEMNFLNLSLWCVRLYLIKSGVF